MTPGFFFLVGAAFLAFIGYYVFQGWMEQKRADAYQQFCAKRGFHYEATRPGAEKQYALVVTIFTRGYSHRWRDEISGHFDSIPFTAFEYLYTVSSGRSSVTHKVAMIHWQTPGLDLPRFTLAPEAFFDHLGEFFGAQDINFADDQAFSRIYVVKGTDEAAVRGLLTTSVLQALGAKPLQFVAGAATELFWWQKGRLPPPD